MYVFFISDLLEFCTFFFSIFFSCVGCLLYPSVLSLQDLQAHTISLMLAKEQGAGGPLLSLWSLVIFKAKTTLPPTACCLCLLLAPPYPAYLHNILREEGSLYTSKC